MNVLDRLLGDIARAETRSLRMVEYVPGYGYRDVLDRKRVNVIGYPYPNRLGFPR